MNIKFIKWYRKVSSSTWFLKKLSFFQINFIYFFKTLSSVHLWRMFDNVVQTLQTTRDHGYKFSQYSNNQSKRQLNCTRHQSQIIFYIKIHVCGTIMQENKIRLNSFLCIPKWVDKHGTAVGACWRTTKSGWTINDQP